MVQRARVREAKSGVKKSKKMAITGRSHIKNHYFTYQEKSLLPCACK